MNELFQLQTYKGDFSKITDKNKILLLADSVHYFPGDYPHKPNYGGAAFKVYSTHEHNGTGTVDRYRHMDGANVLFVDGHVQWLAAAQIPVSRHALPWRPQ